MSDPVAPFRAELDRAAETGRVLDVWWRDDDATAATPALDRLLALAQRYEVPLALAAIPALCEPGLPARLAAEPAVAVLVHGWRHANHAGPGAKPAEFGADRPIGTVRADAATGLASLVAAFGPRALPVFVPPWNRMAPDLPPHLAEIGYSGASTFGPAPPGALAFVNTHCDPVDWRGSRSLADPRLVASSLARHLLRGTDEPFGILTHHLAADGAIWSFMERLMATLQTHPAVRLRGVGDLLATFVTAGANRLAPRELAKEG